MKKVQQVLVLGAGGHARVLLDILLQTPDIKIIGCLDTDLKKKDEQYRGISVLGDETLLVNYSPLEYALVNGVGSVVVSNHREALFNCCKEKGYHFYSVAHPQAILSEAIELGEGVQIMAGVVIQPGCAIGANTIINTGALIDHDCQIGKHVHVGPGVVCSGGVEIGMGAHIGTGATIIQNISIGEETLVAAGAVVIRSVKAKTAVYGVPAREKMQG